MSDSPYGSRILMTRTIPTMAMTIMMKCATHQFLSLLITAPTHVRRNCASSCRFRRPRDGGRCCRGRVPAEEGYQSNGFKWSKYQKKTKNTHWKCVDAFKQNQLLRFSKVIFASFLHGALQLSAAENRPLPAVSYRQKLFSQCLKPKGALEVHKAGEAQLLRFSDSFWPTCLGHNVHFVSFCLETVVVFPLHSGTQPVLGITKMCRLRHQWRWDFFCTRFCSTFPFSLRQKSNVMLSSSLFNKLTAKGITLSFQAVWSRGLRYRSRGFLANDPWKTWFQDIASSPNSVKTSNHFPTSHLTVRTLMLEILAYFTKLRRFCEVCSPSEVKLPLHQIFVHLGERIHWRQLWAEKVAFNFHHGDLLMFSGKRKRMKGKK